MLYVEQFRYADNFSYLIYGEKEALVVDGGASTDIISFLQKNNLVLTAITNTHQHFDHTSGNDDLLRVFRANILGFTDLIDNKEIHLDGEIIVVYRTPGHSADSVCFHTGNILLSGDTLFNGTIGNCFTGDLYSFYQSILRLMTLPDETIIYAGHDYVRDALNFAKHLEPENKEIDKFRKLYNADHVYSTMADERRINPYLRFNEEPVIQLLKKKGLPRATEWERWQSLMSIQ